MPSAWNQAERQERMKIKMRYETTMQEFEIEIGQAEKWLNISIKENESQEEYEKRVQLEADIQYNRPDYNNWHKHSRHAGDTKRKNDDGEIEVNSEESIMEKAADESIYTHDIDEMDKGFEYDYYCDLLREYLKPDTAEMIIAIVLDGMTVGEYAESIGDDANNVSHRYRRAIKNLKKLF